MTPVSRPVAKDPSCLRALRISPDDTNYFICLADPVAEGVPFTFVVEVYEPGGATPPNTHGSAYEFFYILHGQGRGHCDGVAVELRQGSCLLLPPGKEHIVENTGAGRLYAFCAMVPNEDFAEMIHAGTPVELDATDIAVLTGRN
jgi:mannose-6-phosphate isomerase-like protein (cupin superfamily)